MNLIDMTTFIVSNAVIVMAMCEIVNFVSNKGVFYTCCKWAEHYNIKSVRKLETAGGFAFIDIFFIKKF